MQPPTGPSPEQAVPAVVGMNREIPLRARLRAVASWVRRFPERALHPVRRRAAGRVVAAAPTPRSILVVCYGNVCRSPYAALALRQRLPEGLRQGIEVTSAGFVGPNRGSPPDAIRVAFRLGIDLTQHRSELLTPENTGAADLVLVMDSGQQKAIQRRFSKPVDRVLVLGDFDPEPIAKRTIRDPWNQSEEIFTDSYRRIDRCVDRLVGILSGIEPAE